MQSIIPDPGAAVVIRGERWSVVGVTREGGVARLDVEAREPPAARRSAFLLPFDVVTRVRRDRWRRARPQQARARLVRLIAGIDRVGVPLAARSAHVNLLPHQLEPALAVLAGVRRLLIADDVGLGKTIQAALVIAELSRRRPSCRALVAVPATLIDQWTAELRDRVGLDARRVDAAALGAGAAALPRSANPWSHAGVVVASLDYLKQRHVIDALPPMPWDVVVIDEAHLACGDSERRRAADALASRARHVLLLTATPHTGDASTALALRQLGAITPGDRLIVMRRTRRDLTWPSNRRVRVARVRPGVEEARLLDALVRFGRVADAVADPAGRAGSHLLLAVLRKRALSTPDAFMLSVARRLEWLRSGTAVLEAWQPSLDFGDTDVMSVEERRGLTANTGLDRALEERWLTRLETLGASASRIGAKMRALTTLVRRTRDPVIVFTEFRDSLTCCRQALDGVASVVELHGGLSAPEQRVALASFARTSRVLIATDVASQGLNLQHLARWVINLDMPWNPARLEQRIGRVDRIGQARPVHATVLTVDHPLDHALLDRIRKRVAFAQAECGDAHVLGGTLPASMTADAETVPAAVGASVTFRSTTRWVRAAQLVARDLARRRALMQGQPAGVKDGRPLRSRWHMAGRVRHCRAIVSVPILGSDDRVIERHVMAFEIGGELATLDIASATAARTLTKRRVQAEARLRRRAARAAAVESALAAILSRPFVAGETQAGLFDTRARRDQARADDIVRDIHLALERECRRVTAALTLRIGPPRLEILFE